MTAVVMLDDVDRPQDCRNTLAANCAYGTSGFVQRDRRVTPQVAQSISRRRSTIAA